MPSGVRRYSPAHVPRPHYLAVLAGFLVLAGTACIVSSLLDKRAEARAAKDFAAADAIRDQLKAAGIELEDTPQGPQWSL